MTYLPFFVGQALGSEATRCQRCKNLKRNEKNICLNQVHWVAHRDLLRLKVLMKKFPSERAIGTADSMLKLRIDHHLKAFVGIV